MTAAYSVRDEDNVSRVLSLISSKGTGFFGRLFLHR